MSTLRTTTLGGALIATTVKIGLPLADLATPENLNPTQLSGVLTALVAITWTSFWGLHATETLRDHIDRTNTRTVDILTVATNTTITHAIAAAVDDAEQRGATDARLELMRKTIHQRGGDHDNGRNGCRPHLVT